MAGDDRVKFTVSTAFVIVIVTCAMIVMTVLLRSPALPGGGSPWKVLTGYY